MVNEKEQQGRAAVTTGGGPKVTSLLHLGENAVSGGGNSTKSSHAPPLLPQTRSPTRASSSSRRGSPTSSSPERISWRWLALTSLTVASVMWLLVALGRPVASRRAQHRARTSRSLIGFESSERRSQVLPKDLAGERTWWTMDDLLVHPLLTKHPVPMCNLNVYQKDRYAPLLSNYRYQGPTYYINNKTRTLVPHHLPRTKLKYLVAINLKDSDYVLPALIRVLYTVISALGPARFHVSIYENDSKDTTPAQLYLFAMVLERLGAGYTIHSDPGVTEHDPNKRIEYLAGVRNRVLEPVFNAPRGTFDRVLFVNDVHLCEADLFELLLQHEVQGADMSCGMDYKTLKIKEFAPDYPVLFYDVWVARDMLGLPFYDISYPTGNWNLPSNPLPLSPDRFRLHNLQSFQVFSCWNGATVLDADLFANPRHAIRFRSDEGTNRQSECYLICSDIWKTYSPYLPGGTPQPGGRGAKIQVVPRTIATYEHFEYDRVRQDKNTTAFEREGRELANSSVAELIEWKRYPPRLVNTYDFAYWHGMTRTPPFH